MMCDNPTKSRTEQYNDDDLAPKAKKCKKERGPTLTYNITEHFSNNGKKPGGTHLEFVEIKRLMLLPINGKSYPCFPTWCKVKGWEKISKVVVLTVLGVSEKDYHEKKTLFPSLSKHFQEPIPFKLDGTGDFSFRAPLESFVMYKMSKKILQNKLQKGCKSQNDGFNQYLLTSKQLEKDNFPEWNSSAKEHGVVSTRKTDKCLPNAKSEIYCIDCEMCETKTENHALTKISIVDRHLNVIYDKLVKPKDEIIDYMTKYSGITADMMEGVKTRLKDVQNDILSILSPDSILVGHSLDFDLRALKLHHDNIIDTSVLYEDQRGPHFKSSLKFLAKKYLQKDIQQSEKGHCSLEDARTCMELALLKMEQGASFGLAYSGEESVYEALSRNNERGALIANPDFVLKHSHGNHQTIPCTSDEEAVNATKSSIKTCKFNVCELRDYEKVLHEYQDVEKIPEDEKNRIFEKLDKNISCILESIPPSCLVVVSLCNGFLPKSVSNLLKDKEKRRSKEVRTSVREARLGICFAKIT